MSVPRPDARQFIPEGYPPLPLLRIFKVMRPSGLSDELVEATGVGIEAEGVLKFSEIIYVRNPGTGEYEMLQYVRRMFRVWLDVEEVVGGVPMTSAIN